MTRFVLIRHGETDWNLEGRYQGQSDVPLNDRGRRQSAELVAELRENPPAAIYCSDLNASQRKRRNPGPCSGCACLSGSTAQGNPPRLLGRNAIR